MQLCLRIVASRSQADQGYRGTYSDRQSPRRLVLQTAEQDSTCCKCYGRGPIMAPMTQPARISPSTAKAQTERAFFEALAPLAGFAVDLSTMRQHNPPAPDIECTLTNGAPFSAELVALDDPATRTRLTNMVNTKACWYDARDTWPATEQAAIAAFSRDLWLSAIFTNDAGQRDRKRVFIEVQRLLLDLPSNFEGDLLVALRTAGMAVRVQYMRAHRGGTTGIRISAPSSGGWHAPNHTALRAKLMHVPYMSGAPVHLFAYSEHDDLDAHVTSLAGLEILVRQHLATMPFAAVHFFDWWGPRHLLTIP